MPREDSAGEGGRVKGDAGASFGGRVARPKKKRGVWDRGIARTVLGPVKARALNDAGMEKRELALVLTTEAGQTKHAKLVAECYAFGVASFGLAPAGCSAHRYTIETLTLCF